MSNKNIQNGFGTRNGYTNNINGSTKNKEDEENENYNNNQNGFNENKNN